MIAQMLDGLGPWAWLILGLLLLSAELVMPGVFLMWFGLAGVVIGILTLAPFTDVSWWPWQAQLVGFGVLSLIFIVVGTRLFPTRGSEDDASSKMNDPLGRHIGIETNLIEALENGSGRVKIGDTTWRVTGSDMPEGTRVRVVSSKDGALQVEAV